MEDALKSNRSLMGFDYAETNEAYGARSFLEPRIASTEAEIDNLKAVEINTKKTGNIMFWGGLAAGAILSPSLAPFLGFIPSAAIQAVIQLSGIIGYVFQSRKAGKFKTAAGNLSLNKKSMLKDLYLYPSIKDLSVHKQGFKNKLIKLKIARLHGIKGVIRTPKRIIRKMKQGVELTETEKQIRNTVSEAYYEHQRATQNGVEAQASPLSQYLMARNAFVVWKAREHAAANRAIAVDVFRDLSNKKDLHPTSQDYAYAEKLLKQAGLALDGNSTAKDAYRCAQRIERMAKNSPRRIVELATH